MNIEKLKQRLDFIATAILAWDDDAVEFSEYKANFYDLLQEIKNEISKKGVSATFPTTPKS